MVAGARTPRLRRRAVFGHPVRHPWRPRHGAPRRRDWGSPRSRALAGEPHSCPRVARARL